MSEKPIRTGIFGGSFNPVHNGHLALADQIIRRHLVDELWFMVSPQNPLKQDRTLLPEPLRLELTRMAVKGHRHLCVSDFECHLPRPSYMVETLAQLCSTYPNRRFSLIIGADNWINFHRWYRYEDILRQHDIIVYPREGFNVDKSALPKNVTLLDMPLYPISSTDIRRRLRENLPVSEYLPTDVERTLRDWAKTTSQSF